MVKNFVPDRAFQTGAPPYMNVRSLLTSTCSTNEPPVVLDADSDGWYSERVYHL